MANLMTMNEWTFSGEVFYLKELERDYGASLKIRGSSLSGNDYSRIVELNCLLTKDAYKEAIKKGIGLYKNVTISGHMETFVRSDNKKTKTMFIAEYVLEVE